MTGALLSPSTLTTYDLSALTGIAYRRIDYWCRTNLLFPTRPAEGSGTRREFDVHHVKVVLALDAVMRTIGTSGPLSQHQRDPQVVMAACWFDDHRGERWKGDYSLTLTPVSRLVLDLAEIEARAAEAFA